METPPAALITDYDGTLAQNGCVAAATVAALERWRAAGGRLVLATGRHLEDLKAVCPCLGLFDYAAAEDGAVLLRPADGEAVSLAPPPPPEFLQRLTAAGVPWTAGQVIVATTRPWLEAVRQTIRASNLPLSVSLNKGAVMVLPAGIDKAFGVRAAMKRLELPLTRAVGIGDAENDASFLALCSLAVAVADALEPLREMADRVTAGGAGAGVVELIDELLASR